MMSRGFLYSLGAGARKSLVLLWTAVLLCSMLAQYAAFAAPQQALALDASLFELDGNVTKETYTDWNTINNGGGSPFAKVFIDDPINGNGDKYFDGGNTKDTSNIPSWAWTTVSQPQDKNDIENAYAAAYHDNGHLVVFFGLDRYAANGDAQAGFWFLQNEFGLTGGPNTGGFAGTHKEGDVLVQIDFQNGGADPVLRVYRWTGGALALTDTGGSCATAPSGATRCGIASTGDTDPNWTFDDKFANGTDNLIPAGGMVEGGIDLTALNLDGGCFASFVAETRSSQSPTSTLSDFANGSFALCSKPDITTNVRQGGSTTSVINKGESVFDRAVLTGDSGTVTGSVKFFVCRDADAAPDCSTGGTQVGDSVTLADGRADSAEFTPTQLGYYCFRAAYTPADGSKYLATSHTNKTSECFRVIPADVFVKKTAGPSPVSAGDDISFSLSWGNKGEGKATGVVVSDTLPGTAGLNWSITGSTGTGSTCSITGAPGSQVLTCNVGAINGNVLDSGSVTIGSDTTKASCSVIENTGSITSANDGSGSDKASVQVLCPDIKVTKTPDDGSISAGDTATFTIKVENLGPGKATNVVVTDTLPTGLTWTETEDDCAISGGVLTCTIATLAADASKTYTVSAVTAKANCGVINNEAQASATNEPGDKLANNSDTGAITVGCAVIDIAKTADHEVVNAGDTIGFTITVTNTGNGNAYAVTASDTLNPNFTWTLVPSVGWSLSGNVLSYTAGTLASGASSSAHVTAPTTAVNCGIVPNKATASAGNDGSDEASAQVEILCPDVKVEKTAVASPVNAGDPIAFDIVVTNLGPGAAYGVTLTDTLPAGIAWSENSLQCSITGGVLACNFGDLAKDATASVRVSGTTSNAVCTTVINTAVVAATNEPAGLNGNNTDGDSVLVNCPDIKVVKDAVTTPINAGDAAGFTMTVTNLGPGTAYGVTLNDPLPAGISWTENSAACEITNGVLSCTFGSLAQGASASVTVTGTSSAEVCGTLPNTATVAATNEIPGATANNTDGASIVVNCPDIKVTKTAANSPISAGETASFTITVENIGAGAAYDVALVDSLPGGLTWTDSSDVCEIANGVLSCTFGTILPGITRTVTVTAETTAVSCGSLPNLATSTASNEPSGVLANNKDDATIVVDCPQIIITKSTVTPVVSAGDDISFDVVVTNTGVGSAFGVTVNDPLPVVTGVSWSIDTDPAHTTGAWSIVAGVLKFGPATLAGGGEVKVRIVSDTTSASCRTIPNVANLTYTGGSGSDDSALVVECPDVTISKTAAKSPINAGDTASFTISAWNEGPGTAYDVVIKDTLPAGVTWTSDNAACSIVAGVLTCNVGTLADNAAPFTVTVSGVTDGADCGPLDNLARVDASNEPVANKGNNEDSATVAVDCARIDVIKTADNAVVSAGDQIGFTITVTNTGAGTAYAVTASDSLNPNFTWTIVPSAGWTLNGTTLSYSAASLATGASSSVHVTAPTTAESCGIVPNTATASAGNDGTDEASAQVEILCPDVRIEKTADNSPILAGQIASFDISAWNKGPGTAYNVVVTDTLPAGFAWTENSEACSITNGVLTCQVGTLTATDKPFTVTVSAPTTVAACGQIPNSASVAASNEPAAANANNADDATVEVQCASISLVKTAGNAADGAELLVVKPGNVIFTYVVTNTGTAPLMDISLVDDNATPADIADDITVTCPSLTLAAGATMTCTATLPVTFGLRTNIAVVTATPVLEPQGEVKDTDDAVVRVPQPEVTPTPRPTPRLTPPPTFTIDTTEEPTSAGNGLLMILLALAGTMLAVGYLIPSQARSRRRNDRG